MLDVFSDRVWAIEVNRVDGQVGPTISGGPRSPGGPSFSDEDWDTLLGLFEDPSIYAADSHYAKGAEGDGIFWLRIEHWDCCPAMFDRFDSTGNSPATEHMLETLVGLMVKYYPLGVPWSDADQAMIDNNGGEWPPPKRLDFDDAATEMQSTAEPME